MHIDTATSRISFAQGALDCKLHSYEILYILKELFQTYLD